MGERVDAASNEIINIGGEDGILCLNCGEDSDLHPTGYLGWTDLEWAEKRWLEVDGALACSVYCASKVAGFSEKEAQLNRAAKTRANMRAAGLDELAEKDEKVVPARLEQRKRDIEEFGGSVIADIEKLTSSDGEPHGLDLPDESAGGEGGDSQEVWEQIKGGGN